MPETLSEESLSDVDEGISLNPLFYFLLLFL